MRTSERRPRRLAALAAAMLAVALLPSPAAADDEPTCLGLPATITGTSGPDELVGTGGPDVIVGLGGDDLIRARGGDDVVCAGSGDDLVIGGKGDDRLLGGTGDDELRGDDGADLLQGAGGADRLDGGKGDDRLEGGAGDDRLVGSPGADELSGWSGDDVLHGGSGDDLLHGGDDADDLVGHTGADVLYGDDGDDLLRGKADADVLYGGEGADELRGGGGPDVLEGEAGPDLLLGSGGEDTLLGGDGADELWGERHADGLDGGPGDDVIWEFQVADTHLAAGRPDAEGDVFAHDFARATPVDGWMLWRPTAGQLEQGHEGVLTITNRSDGLLMIERIAPERYLLGIAEMPYSWEPAALQSQAIAARTYLASMVTNPPYGPQAEYGFDICDHAACQVYKGTKYGWMEPWEDAVVATAGRVLLYGGAPASTFYHSTSGATTRSIQDVWTSSPAIPYLQAVAVPEQDSPFAAWWYTLPLEGFMDVLARDGITVPGTVEAIRTIVTEPGGGPYRVKIRSDDATRVYPISDIQRALNRHALAHYGTYLPALHHTLGQAALSPTFTVRLRPDGQVAVKGYGWGHQIGLSQYGANAMATAGATADDILGHFYTGLAPEAAPDLIPGLIDVGLFYENGDHPIVLNPTGRYVLRGPAGVIARGSGATITITRYGDDAVAVTVQP